MNQFQLLNNDDGPEAKRSKNDIVNEKIATGTPVYGFKNGTVPCNAKLAEMIEIVKPLLRYAKIILAYDGPIYGYP